MYWWAERILIFAQSINFSLLIGSQEPPLKGKMLNEKIISFEEEDDDGVEENEDEENNDDEMMMLLGD